MFLSHFNLNSHAGDNLLTAVSVARECGMIPQHHQAIVMKAEIQGQDSQPAVSYEPLNADGSVPEWHEMQIEHSKPQDFHLIIDGKSFAVVKEHCTEDLLNKVHYYYSNISIEVTLHPFSCSSKGQYLLECHQTKRLNWL